MEVEAVAVAIERTSNLAMPTTMQNPNKLKKGQLKPITILMLSTQLLLPAKMAAKEDSAEVATVALVAALLVVGTEAVTVADTIEVGPAITTTTMITRVTLLTSSQRLSNMSLKRKWRSRKPLKMRRSS